MNDTRQVMRAAFFSLAAALFAIGLSSVTWAEPMQQASNNPVLTIAPGDTASLNMRGFCLDPRKPFPDTVNNPTGVVSPTLQAALNYAAQRGYDTSNPAQVQEAVWFIVTGTWQNPDHQLGQEIVTAANDQANRVTDPSGTSILAALQNNRIQVSTRFTPAADVAPNEAFYGTGVITITNTTSDTLNLFMPYGVIFPPQDPANQRLVGYAFGVAQPAPTGTPQPTSTPQPTNTAVPTETPVPVDTPTPLPTDTPVPADTPTPVPTDTPVPAPLPDAGAGPGDGAPVWLWLFLAGFASLLGGFAIRRNAAQA